ncbi:MAG: dihydrofolate reductase family protein [Terracoccus sp.]
MRLLVPGSSGLTPLVELDDALLYAAYAPARSPWLRCNMVTSLDGSATGGDGRSGSINDPADHVVFEVLRASADAIVVGAGTVRAESYPPLSVAASLLALRRGHDLDDALPLVVVSNRGAVPPTVAGHSDGSVLLAVPERSDGLDAARASLGDEHVIVCGADEVDLRILVEQLHDRGLTRLLTEGGPGLLGSFLAAGLVDELCFTVAPRVVGGDHPRPVGVAGVPIELELALLVEQDGTLMGRWLTRR